MTVKVAGNAAQIGSTAAAPYRSLIDPITGPDTAVAIEPDAPTMARSSAPPRGNRSEVIPIMLGHQNAVPTASSAAATNQVAGPVACPKRNKPTAASGAV